MKKGIKMYGDDIDREWIYMLEDKLVVIDELEGKIIRHNDFLDVVEKWEKLRDSLKTKRYLAKGVYEPGGYEYEKQRIENTVAIRFLERFNPEEWFSISDEIIDYILQERQEAIEEYKKELRPLVEEIKLNMDVVVCDCGEPYRDSDVAGYVDELLNKLNQPKIK